MMSGISFKINTLDVSFMNSSEKKITEDLETHGGAAGQDENCMEAIRLHYSEEQGIFHPPKREVLRSFAH